MQWAGGSCRSVSASATPPGLKPTVESMAATDMIEAFSSAGVEICFTNPGTSEMCAPTRPSPPHPTHPPLPPD